MQPGLSFEQAPPISVPFRFFLTAPIFGVGAGLLLLWQGPAVLASRWTSAALALTHLVAVGFMLQAMCGALMQMVPVAVGANIWQPRRVTQLTHAGLTLGAALLVAGFLTESTLFFRIAAPLMAVSLGVFALIVLIALFRTSAQGPTVVALRMAAFGLIVTIALGVTLASGFGWQVALPLTELTHVHAAWGLVGWSLLLVVGVAYLAVPMFQLTPPYPRLLARSFSIAMFVLLSAWSLTWLPLQRSPPVQVALACIGAVLAATFAIVTLRLQAQRRRKIVDPTLMFWRVAMAALIAAAVLGIVQQLSPELAEHAGTPFLLGVLLMIGVFLPVISGMLYKIVPFLNWLHLQKLAKPGSSPVPNMKQMIPEARITTHFRLHLAALVLMLGAVAVPQLLYPAALALIGSCAWLEWNLITATRVYARHLRVLEQREAVAA